jgi:hypothetical protein
MRGFLAFKPGAAGLFPVRSLDTKDTKDTKGTTVKRKPGIQNKILEKQPSL